ncbi:polysaccharide biosynthesis/export family protein [Mesorhizobium sp. UC22_110]|jgi:exopolysaccharide production protein ExoF|uniref:polysaccharide biosynthesis/export family protein n=1 Tax=unclassified Mesorhizobium TaxID=325217 RepID=UPI00366DA78D
MLMATSASMAADGYRLDAMDKLRIRVAEWQSAEGAVRDWATISGDYSVNPAGEVSLPFVGELDVKGKTTTEVAAAIAAGLQQKLGLPDRPEASVEIAEFRPVFLAGDVQTPGKYPYAPGLTVLKAMSLAGGLRRADSGQGGVRDFIQAQGNYDVLIAQRNGLLARRARLIAEAENKDQIDFPPELNKTDVGRKLMADETALKEAREKRLRLQLTALDDLKKLLQSEIESLSKKIVTQNRQVELSKDELKSISGLAEKGLVVNQRIMSLERTSAELEGKVLDLETASLRAKQDISKATQDATKLQNDRDTEVAQSRQQTEADLEEMGFKVGMYSGLMTEAMTRAPDAARTANNGTEPVIRYAIVRTGEDGKSSEVAADENTQILPGDVVKIEIAGPNVTSN